MAAAGRAGRQRGDGSELFELRELMPGDSFRRIAWKASAKRGQVVVKEFEREERDVVMVVLDASVELWSGPMGGAPLDRAVDAVATLALHHITRGDLVGLSVFGGRELTRVAPDSGRRQASRIVSALIEHTGVLAADRSGWDESDMAVQVTEHLRPLDPRAVSDLRKNRIDKLVRRASSMLGHAPFSRPPPEGRTPRDSRLRHYAACFGMHVPARLEPDRARAAATLASLLGGMAKASRGRRTPRVSIVHVVAPPPPDTAMSPLQTSIRKLRARGVMVRWTTPPVATALDTIHDDLPQVEVEGATVQLPHTAILPIVERTVVMRAAIANRQGEQALRRLGVKVVRASRGRAAGSAEGGSSGGGGTGDAAA
jgi:hypothetical protein